MRRALSESMPAFAAFASTELLLHARRARQQAAVRTRRFISVFLVGSLRLRPSSLHLQHDPADVVVAFTVRLQQTLTIAEQPGPERVEASESGLGVATAEEHLGGHDRSGAAQ